MSCFDMDKLMQQAAQMQEQVERMQEEAAKETAQSSVGGGLVKVTANGAGEVVSIEISPDAIDPADPEALADLVLAGRERGAALGAGRRRGEGAADARRHGPRWPRPPRARRVTARLRRAGGYAAGIFSRTGCGPSSSSP